jgi:hypothetical protein
MCRFRFVPRSRSPSSRCAYEHGQRAALCPQDTVPIDQRTAPHDLTSRSPNLARPRSVADPRRGCRCGSSRHDAARQIRESRSAVDVPGTVRRSTAARSRRRLSRTPARAARQLRFCAGEPRQRSRRRPRTALARCGLRLVSAGRWMWGLASRVRGGQRGIVWWSPPGVPPWIVGGGRCSLVRHRSTRSPR